uniref:Putative methyltransferase rhodnius neglectus n=1 Tax=Rhodnius prolixus TaxID=13249 RepID=A0A4V0Y8P4_RHOPR
MSNLEVQSETYDEKDTFNKNSLALLEFLQDAGDEVEVDEDGDILVPRTKNKLEIEFSTSTTIPHVGLQIWRGALLLADFIQSHSEIFKDKIVLELGSGVGLGGVVAGMHAKEVICSDIDKCGILQLIKRNINRNKKLLKGKVGVSTFDFYQQEWSVHLTRKIKQSDVIIAADVIYEDSLTEAFVECITKILQTPPVKRFYLALEKRYVFTMAHLDSVAPCYEYFLKCLRNKWSKYPMCNWSLKELKTDFKQYFNYVRTKELVLWEILVQ